MPDMEKLIEQPNILWYHNLNLTTHRGKSNGYGLLFSTKSGKL